MTSNIILDVVNKTVNISAIDGDATTITITTSSAHGLSANNFLTIAGTTNYNGVFPAKTASGTSITISSIAHNEASEATGTVTHNMAGTNSLIIYTTNIEEVKTNKIIPIVLPTTKANWGAGPKTTKIVDLLMVTTRFNIDGKIESDDREKFRNLGGETGVAGGGTFTMEYGEDHDGNIKTYSVIIEKYMITEGPSDSGVGVNPNHYTVKFTVLVGENL